MAWGGSLNSDGSKYYRIVRKADKAVEFLENLKKYLNQEEQVQVSKTIDIIVDHINSLSEGKVKEG